MATPQGPQVCVAVLRVVRVSGRGLRGVAVLKPELQVVHDDGREVFEGLDVLGVECARLAVQDAQGPQVEAVTGAQRDACVEPKPELARYQRVRQRTHVDCRVLDDPWAFVQDGRGTQPRVAIELVDLEPVVGLEPDAVVIDHAHYRDRHGEEPGGKGSDPVEGAVWWAVQDVVPVHRYDILDSPPDGAFDRITALAARLFSVPIAIVSVVDHDRIWFKSHHGLEIDQLDRDAGLCASAILHEGPWIIEDAAVDVRALSNPLVAGEFGLRFYAGIPLRTRDGFNLGTLCILDREPRTLDTQDVKALEDLAAIVMNDLELRLENRHAPETTARHADYP